MVLLGTYVVQPALGFCHSGMVYSYGSLDTINSG